MSYNYRREIDEIREYACKVAGNSCGQYLTNKICRLIKKHVINAVFRVHIQPTFRSAFGIRLWKNPTPEFYLNHPWAGDCEVFKRKSDGKEFTVYITYSD